MEFFTIFNISVPGLLGELSAFRKKYEIPILRGQDADASDTDHARGQERSSELLTLCGGYMLRRTRLEPLQSLSRTGTGLNSSQSTTGKHSVDEGRDPWRPA